MISVVIPTLQKNREVLDNLISTLLKDDGVGEIIVVDNSLKGLEYSNEKLRVIIPSENLFVNPSWNLGVKESKNEVVALFNDDISIPNGLCGEVLKNMTPDMGIIGMGLSSIEEKPEISKEVLPPETKMELKPIGFRDRGFGVIMFFNRAHYFEIPEDIKIYYGDDWLMYKNRKAGRKNYIICGTKIEHIGSLSCSNTALSEILKNDSKLYKKLTIKWYKRLLSFEEIWDCYKIRFMGLTFKVSKADRKKA